MADEKTFNIPLRKEFRKSPPYRRSKKAITAIKQFLEKHMKSKEVKMGNSINLKVWEHGIKNPPHHVKVIVTKDDKGIIKAELFGYKPKEKKKAEKKATKTEKKEEAAKENPKKADSKE